MIKGTAVPIKYDLEALTPLLALGMFATAAALVLLAI
jgi:hypothetical protein